MATLTTARPNGRSAIKKPDLEKEPLPVEVEAIRLPRLARDTLRIQIVGTAPLIVHRFDEKARAAIINPPPRGAAKEKRDEAYKQAAYERSMYRFDDGGHGFPATGFKAALVSSAEAFPKLYGSTLKRWIRIEGEIVKNGESLVRLKIVEPKRREDYVRIKSGMGKVSASMVWRAEYWPWSATLTVIYPRAMFPSESIVALVDAAGFGGVGEWRPNSPESKTGAYGTFEVLSE